MIRVPSSFNSTFITRHFFPEDFKNNSPISINSGRCYEWSYYAHRLFGSTLWSTDYHAWIQHDDKFYDSETRVGVNHFMALGCNKRYAPIPWEEQQPITMSLEEFKRFWNNNGGGERYHWDSKLEPYLKKVLGIRFREVTPIFRQSRETVYHKPPVRHEMSSL